MKVYCTGLFEISFFFLSRTATPDFVGMISFAFCMWWVPFFLFFPSQMYECVWCCGQVCGDRYGVLDWILGLVTLVGLQKLEGRKSRE